MEAKLFQQILFIFKLEMVIHKWSGHLSRVDFSVAQFRKLTADNFMAFLE